jgi:putative ABC transport system permease protein
LIALTISFLTVINTMLAAVVERAGELGVMRALGASRRQVFTLLAYESLGLTAAGSLGGVLLISVAGGALEAVVRSFIPFAPQAAMLHLTVGTVLQCLALGLAVGLVAMVYPAWRASRTEPASALKEVST